MRYNITATEIVFFTENPKRDTPSAHSISLSGVQLDNQTLHRFCALQVRQGLHKSIATQRSQLKKFLKPILLFFSCSRSAMPTTSDDWQIFLLSFFQFYLGDSRWSKASVQTRMSDWSLGVRGTFTFWCEEGMVPWGVSIPEIRLKDLESGAAASRVLGERTPTPVLTRDPPDKLLVNIDFGLPGDEFLERIEEQCRHKVGLIQQTCLNHWTALMQDASLGRYLAVSPSELESAVKSERFSELFGRRKFSVPLASPVHPQGYRWALAVGFKLLREGVTNDCVHVGKLYASPFFKNRCFLTHDFRVLNQVSAMPSDVSALLTSHDKYCRFLGLMSALDASVACCLLTIEHPQFTPESLQNAKLLNSAGKSYLLLTDSDKSSLFSVDKPRAGVRKTVPLTPIAQQLIEDIIRLTEPVRQILKKAGDKAWRFLFLGYRKGGLLSALSPKARYLTGSRSGKTLVSLYPVLEQHGLTQGTFDFRRIRATMGVLTWFETGSIQAMSKRLGNSSRVVLEHYLPAALLRAWNTRIIRRFQNTLIILAAYDEPYLLELTDFNSIGDLQNFIAQIVLEYPGSSSPLAIEVQRRLGSTSSLVSGATLNIRLSPVTLGHLYAFANFATQTCSAAQLRGEGSSSRLAPRQFVELARMIRHACENEVLAKDLRELLDVQALTRIHEQAQSMLPILASQYAKLSIKNHWGDMNV